MGFSNTDWEAYEQYLLSPIEWLYDALYALYMDVAGFVLPIALLILGMVVLTHALHSNTGRWTKIAIQRSLRRLHLGPRLAVRR